MGKRALLVAIVALVVVGGYGVYTALGSNGPVVPNVFARNVASGELAQSYAALRALDLNVHVAFVNTDTLHVSSSSEEYATVTYMWPRPGTRVKRGDVVTLVAETHGLMSSIAVPKSIPRYRVPDFVGRPAEAAIEWADKRRLIWDIPKLPPLNGSPARQLYAAYVVTAQGRKPGTDMQPVHCLPHGGCEQPRLTLTVFTR